MDWHSGNSEYSGRQKRAAGLLCFLWLLLYGTGALAEGPREIETVSKPANTNIDVLDYWVYNGTQSTVDHFETGINEGHTLHFNDMNNMEELESWNEWTGRKGPARQGIVQPLLGEDGYPVLNVGDKESLAYLFNGENIDVVIAGEKYPAKRAYTGANYMFQVDEDGYYVFDSSIHKGKLNPYTKVFSVTPQQNGEFYPLADSGPNKFFFGVHLRSEFSMPANGLVLNPAGEYQVMAYEFSGDDDIWLFIDGVLVGDVGGIHDAQDLTIDFSTGEVVVCNHETQEHVMRTTLYDAYVAALGEKGARKATNWKKEEDGSYRTYKSKTYHTMDFFYLERGANVSRMKIRYNMISTYDFTSHNVLIDDSLENRAILRRNQFKYKLTGYPLKLKNGSYLEAVMPKSRPDQDIFWEPNYDPAKVLTAENQSGSSEPKTLVVGTSADGNINFGALDLTGSVKDRSTELGLYAGRTFNYTIEELPPDGAVLNEDGVTYTYKGEIISPNEDGSYTFDGIIYDNTVFYYEGYFSKKELDIDKTYYTDDTYKKENDINFVNFVNKVAKHSD